MDRHISQDRKPGERELIEAGLLNQGYELRAYDTVSLRIGYETPTWSLNLYGKNIVGDVPIVGYRSLLMFVNGDQLVPLPRQVGVQLGYRF